MGIVLKPFAWLLLFFYQFFNSYGIALILFAIVVKLILFPVTLKSKKSMIQTSMLSGKMQQLQKQYKNNPERYNQEVQKLYERENVNPMGGCLWSLIPMIVLIGLFYIIREPLTYFMDLTAVQIEQLAAQLNWQEVAVANGWVTQGVMDKLAAQLANGEISSVFQKGAYNQLYLSTLITPENLASLKTLIGSEKLFVMNFSFLGMNMSAIPNWKFWTNGLSWASIGLFLLPLLSTVISFLSMKVSMATNQINQQTQNAQADQTNRVMMITMPLMSLWIGFTLPAGMCIYWIAQYIVTMGQEVICSKLLKKDYEAARKAQEERERQEKEDEKRRKEEARLERQRRLEEEKKNRGKKKTSLKKQTGESETGVRREDSREGIRAYARGRAYIPDRFGGVTPYHDPNEKANVRIPAPEETEEPVQEEPLPLDAAEEVSEPGEENDEESV